MQIAVVGTGYVGLVSGVCFAEFGFDVSCIDNNLEKISELKNGRVPIYEPGLDKLLIKNLESKRLKFTSSMQDGVKSADIIFIAVGTPSLPDGSADLSYIYESVKELAKYVKKNAVLVIKSTVPVGTTRAVKKFLLDLGVDIDVAFNPEFLKEGGAVDDFMRPDRIILGVATEAAKKVLTQVYRPLFVFSVPIVFTNLETAELSKYASNAFLAMKVAFINEIANLCEKCDADVNDVALAMGLDKRIGDKFLQAGPGYGGSCFPKDTKALANFAEQFGAKMRIVNETIASNDARREKMIEKILNACDHKIEGKKLAVLGVTFKANTDDMRDSPSVEIIKALQNRGAHLTIFDPSFSEQAKKIFKDIPWAENVYHACQDADVVLILTDWSEFRAINLNELKKIMRHPFIIDLRNIYSVEEVTSLGFQYCTVGRKFKNKTEK